MTTMTRTDDWSDGWTGGYRACMQDADDTIADYIERTDQHKVNSLGLCSVEGGDRCDITAALRVLRSEMSDVMRTSQ